MKAKRKKEQTTNESEVMRLMLGYLCITTEAEASLERKVEILDRFNLTDAEIAKICGGAIQSIRNARYSLRRLRRARKA